ncbi:chymotrypsin-like protease CTRL-1 [Agrilus planipennis]|uniref:Chymotrypsin-like protease CTRL-1 n=1 Tax=Agrilus planipennis TaxID=224129 RepID=A0A1W4WIV2_AGRPL|nr:chymotrypsin-like protease CTRL-1 [Agrilus planipennis]XP_025836583.1 chymotrypsin-like protease CTRL-1 [Agrilus planipennis]
MKFLVVLFGLVCALAHGLPNVVKVDSLRSVYAKDLETLPSDSDDTRVANGDNAFEDEFPYQVSIQWGDNETPTHLCGGSIISESVVLTAAQCHYDYGTYSIVAGILNRARNGESAQRRGVDKFVIHERFSGGVGLYDIALIKVDSPFELTSSVQPVRIPRQGLAPSGTGVVSGWGRTFYNSVLASIMQYATVQIITNNECARTLVSNVGSSSPLDDTQFCTSARVTGRTGRTSICEGDIGGPLVQGFVQVGIISWGVTPCGTTFSPSVYTKVSTYSNWINAKLAQL